MGFVVTKVALDQSCACVCVYMCVCVCVCLLQYPFAGCDRCGQSIITCLYFTWLMSLTQHFGWSQSKDVKFYYDHCYMILSLIS